MRELRNVLERATILCDGGLIAAEHLPRELEKSVDAARLLGLARPQLYHRLRKYGLDADKASSPD